MRLLFDQNLSRRLVLILQDVYPDSFHVQNINLADGDDTTIWIYARERGFAIVTKDADFLSLSERFGHPPKVIRLTCGNCPTSEVAALLLDHHEALTAFYHDEHESFLELG